MRFIERVLKFNAFINMRYINKQAHSITDVILVSIMCIMNIDVLYEY
jgi:hypothetical protein